MAQFVPARLSSVIATARASFALVRGERQNPCVSQIFATLLDAVPRGPRAGSTATRGTALFESPKL